MKNIRDILGCGERKRERKKGGGGGLANGCIHYQQKIGVTPYYQSSNLTPASH